MTLKRGSLKSFFSAMRLTRSSTLACMNASKSESKLKPSIGGSAGSGCAGPGAVAGAAFADSRLRRPQRFRKLSSSCAIGGSAVLGRKKGLRPQPLLRLGPIVLLDKFAQPDAHGRRHRNGIHLCAAIHPAARLVVAHRHVARHGPAFFHAPEHEYVRCRGGHVVEITLGFRALQHDVEPGIKPLRRARRINNDARLAATRIICEHAQGLPYFGLPWVVDGASLHDHGDPRSGLFHRASDEDGSVPVPIAWFIFFTCYGGLL